MLHFPAVPHDIPHWAAGGAMALGGFLVGLALWRVARRYALLAQAGAYPDAALLMRAMRLALRRGGAGGEDPEAPTPGHWMPVASGVALAVAWGWLGIWLGAGLTAAGVAWAVALLLLMAQIDARCGLLPDALTLPLLWTGLALALPGHGLAPLREALATAMGAYAALWLFAWLFQALRGRDGLGGGDVKLIAALGAWLGWQGLFLVVFAASAAGLAAALLTRRVHLTDSHPFGPFLSMAACLVFGLRVSGVLT